MQYIFKTVICDMNLYMEIILNLCVFFRKKTSSETSFFPSFFLSFYNKIMCFSFLTLWQAYYISFTKYDECCLISKHLYLFLVLMRIFFFLSDNPDVNSRSDANFFMILRICNKQSPFMFVNSK